MAFLDKYQAQLLGLLRIVAGLLFLEHGTMKLFGFPAPMGEHLPALMIAAGIIEVVGGALIVVGFFSRIAAFICSGEMAVAYWMWHVGHSGIFWPSLNDGDGAILFCFVFLYLAASGPGAWSLNKR